MTKNLVLTKLSISGSKVAIERTILTGPNCVYEMLAIEVSITFFCARNICGFSKSEASRSNVDVQTHITVRSDEALCPPNVALRLIGRVSSLDLRCLQS